MQVAILAGGYGSRIRSIWRQPKCLAPVAGRPILEHLIDSLIPLRPQRVFLLLGHGSDEVTGWLGNRMWPLDISCFFDDPPAGTMAAVLNLLRNTTEDIRAPLLLLNGDTLPRYSLQGLLEYHTKNACSLSAAWCGAFAGAAVFNKAELSLLEVWAEAGQSLDAMISIRSWRYEVPGFLDVGTPERFYLAQQLKEEEL